jgi:hypothetical protein
MTAGFALSVLPPTSPPLLVVATGRGGCFFSRDGLAIDAAVLLIFPPPDIIIYSPEP